MTLDRSIPRPAIATLASLACLVLGAAMLLGWLTVDRPLPPLSDAVSAVATVTGSRVQPGQLIGAKLPRKQDDRYLVQVTFALSGTQVQANDIEVDQGTFTSHPQGTPVTIWYFPDRPQISVLGDPETLAGKGSHFGQLFGWLFAGLGAVGAVIYGNKLNVARGGRSLL
jgi:hypothetical protein